MGDLHSRADELHRDHTVFVYCRSGRRSQLAKKKLLSLGYTDVRSVHGGFAAWEQAGLPVEKDDKQPWALERQVRFAAGSLVLIGALVSVLVWQPAIWLSAFVGAGLVFAAVTDTCGMAMLLAKMPWNRMPECSPRSADAVTGARS